jgi:hypothetical protein
VPTCSLSPQALVDIALVAFPGHDITITEALCSNAPVASNTTDTSRDLNIHLKELLIITHLGDAA